MMTTVQDSPDTMTLEPVARMTLAGRVALILKRFILMEGLTEGDQLPSERMLAATLDVSPRVVREALGMLLGEGLIVKRHGRGAFVQRLDRERLAGQLLTPAGQQYRPADLHAARCALEIGAMHLAAQSITPDELRGLQKAVAVMKQRMAQGEAIAGDDLSFHLLLLRATHNEVLSQLRYLIVESRRLAVYERPGILRWSRRDESHIIAAHQAIVDALAARDGERAARAMRAHLDRTLRGALQAMSGQKIPQEE